jgi:hypothetical protein
MNGNFNKRKVGVLIVSKDCEYLKKNLKRNDNLEKDLCWYAIPTVDQLIESKPRQILDNSIVKISSELDDDTLKNFKPFWSTYIWRNHKVSLDILLQKGKGKYYMPCMGYGDENRKVFDVQIGLTGTVKDSEDFWDCAVRETYEECNLNINRNQIFTTLEERNKVIYLLEI